MSSNDLSEYLGISVEDDGRLSNLSDVIEEMEDFISQFNSSAMSTHAKSFFEGQESAYKDCLAWLKRINPDY